MGDRVRRHWPMFVAVAAYWIAVIALVMASRARTGGRLVYALDDAYIHMAMAKNVVQHQVWGVTPYGFTSSTSSPLWTALVGLAFFVAGVRDVIPLVLNAVFGTCAVAVAYVVVRRHSPRAALTATFVIAASFIAVLPTLAVIGMEHTLHALLMLAFAALAAATLAGSEAPSLRRWAALTALAALTTATRYEGAFAVAVVALLFVLRGRAAGAAAVLTGGALVPASYGAWSVAHGWYFLPNSVLLKASYPERSLGGIVAFLVGSPALHRLAANPHVLMLLVAVLVALLTLGDARVRDERTMLAAIFVGTTLVHMQLASTGWFYRYEAYLLLLGVVALTVLVADWTAGVARMGIGLGAGRLVTAALLVVITFYPLVSRGITALRMTPRAAANIYDQQYQVGLFLRDAYPGGRVVVNDVGAICYLADIHLLDAFGLGSLDAAGARLEHRFTAAALGRMAAAAGVEIAIVYTSWLDDFGGVPPGWLPVGDWGVTDNVVLGANATSFFAANTRDAAKLVEQLQRFAPDLPAEVMQRGPYTVAPAGNPR